MVGNTLVVKHAPNVPQCALAFERLLLDAGIPKCSVCASKNLADLRVVLLRELLQHALVGWVYRAICHV
jgi:hypothetical protein